MNKNDVMIFAVLSDSLSKGQQPTIEEMAGRVDVSESTVGRSIQRLEADGYISVTRQNGSGSEYGILREPHEVNQMRGWFYRFTPREFWRRMMMAYAAERIYQKARRVRGMTGDAAWTCARDLLFEVHPDVCDLAAVWELDMANDIEHALDVLLEGENEAGDMAVLLAESRNDGR